MGTYDAILEQLRTDATTAAAAAAAAELELQHAADLVQRKREAEHAADLVAAEHRRRAADLAGMRHRARMLEHALKVADLVGDIANEVQAADRTARGSGLASHNGPLPQLREFARIAPRWAARRERWAAERADLVQRIATAERALSGSGGGER